MDIVITLSGKLTSLIFLRRITFTIIDFLHIPYLILNYTFFSRSYFPYDEKNGALSGKSNGKGNGFENDLYNM